MTTGMGNNRLESKLPPSCFFSVKIAFQTENRELNILLPVLHSKQDQDWYCVAPSLGTRTEPTQFMTGALQKFAQGRRGLQQCRIPPEVRLGKTKQRNPTRSFGKGLCWLLKFVILLFVFLGTATVQIHW